MERTINGEPLKEVLEELKKPLDLVGKDYEGNFYLPKDLVDEKLDEILGLNYDFEIIGEPKLIIEGSKKFFVGAGKMTIKDDDGRIVAVRTAGGSSQVIFKKNSTEPKDIGNDFQSCISSIKKKCAKEFGLGRYLSLDISKAKCQTYDSNSAPRRSNNGPNSKNSNEPREVVVTLNSNFSSNKSFYKAEVTTEKGEKRALVIWKDRVADIGEPKVRKTTKYAPNTQLKIKAIESQYKDEKQYILIDIIGVKTA